MVKINKKMLIITDVRDAKFFTMALDAVSIKVEETNDKGRNKMHIHSVFSTSTYLCIDSDEDPETYKEIIELFFNKG